MKRAILLLLFAVAGQLTANAATGDTTLVQAHSDIWLGASPGNFDTTVKFPDGSVGYRRVMMVFTLGKYQCPGSPQYCGDWDYTVNTYLMTKNGDTVELGRLITPYANASTPRTPWTWTERYVYDVTDFYTLLKDSAAVRISYSGYSGGFTANLKFYFVEGTAPRNVLGVERLWHGYFGFGKAKPIDSSIMAMSKNAPAGMQSAEMKFNVTGHGSDNNQCSEFCKKYYQVLVNGNMIEQKDIWRNDCGSNNLYPQSGTWIYDRGNWCPGALVHTNTHKLTGVTAGSGYSVDVDFENYSGSGSAGYGVDACVIYYGGFNKQLDASLDDIVAPNDHEMYYRQNPHTGGAIVHVKNTGATTINSIKFEYGIVNGTYLPQYYWPCNLAPLAEADVELPEPWDMRNATGTNQFIAKILEVNGSADNDASNNTFTSTFTAAPQWPMTLVLTLKTNAGQMTNGNSESEWRIISGNSVVAQRTNNAVNSTYVDTVRLGPGYYRLEVSDSGCDGLKWWANPSAGTGSLLVKSTTSAIPMPLTGYFTGDFGCGFKHYFNVIWPTDVQNISYGDAGISAYPNPASNDVTVLLDGMDRINGTVTIYDAMGRVVLSEKCTTANKTLNTSALNNGMYTIVYADGVNASLKTRLIIAK